MHRTAEYGISAHWKYKGGRRPAPPSLPAVSDEMGWLRQLLEWQREAQAPEEFLDTLRYELNSARCSCFSAEGATSSRCRAGSLSDRLRLRRRTPRSGIMCSRRPGATASLVAAGEHAVEQRRHRRGVHLEGRERRARPRLAELRLLTAGPDQDPSVVRQGAPRRAPSSTAKTQLSRAMRKAGPAPAAVAGRRGAGDVSHGPALRGRGRAVRRGGRGAHLARSPWCRNWWPRLGGQEGAVEDLAEVALPSRTPAQARPRRRFRCGGARRQRRVGQAWRAAAPRCPATTSSASSPAAVACRCTAGPARTPVRCWSRMTGLSRWTGRPRAGLRLRGVIQVEALDRRRLCSPTSTGCSPTPA